VQRLASLCVVLLAASACGARRTDVHTVSGDILFTGTIAYFATWSSTEPAGSGLSVEIHEEPGRCFQTSVPGTGAVLVVSVDSAETSVRPGKFEGNAYYDKWPRELSSASSHVDLDQLSSTEAHGTIDVTLNDETRLQGEFFAAPCPAAALAPADGAPDAEEALDRAHLVQGDR